MPAVLHTVGRYEVVREIGHGGMATVYLARQPDLDRHVALKELAAFRQSDAAFTRRFVRESRVVASFSHPNIVTVHEYFEDDGVPYIAMEYLARGSLRPRMAELTPAQIAGVLEALLAGLAHAEAHGVVHRDLKPENLMLGAQGRVKITDFGLAKATNKAEAGTMLTAIGMAVGTPTYMAPEQAMCREIGPWTDLYSVGCIAYEMLCGTPPFARSDSPMAMLARHVHEEPRPPRDVDPSIAPELSDWVCRLLVKDPKARTQSAAEAWDALEEIVLAALGPRWRRDARIITGDAGTEGTPRPLTPAPFASVFAEEPARKAAVTVTDEIFASAGPTRTEVPAAPAQPQVPAPPQSPSPPVSPPPVAAAPVVAAWPTRTTAPRRRRRGAGRAPATVLCAIPGYVLAPTRSAGHDATSGRVLTNDTLSLQYPAGFRPAHTTPPAPLSDPLGLARTTDSRVTITAGHTTSDGPTLLPPELIAPLDRTPTPTRVRLGPLVAFRYDDLRLPGSRQTVRAYAVPTTAGVATILCAGPPRALPGFAADCDRVASTLRLRAGRAFAAGPSATFARDMDRALAQLRDARRDGLSRARTAPSRAAQADAEAQVAAAYARAAAAIGALDLSPYDLRATGAVSPELENAQEAYKRLAEAARRGDANNYAKALRAVREAESAAAGAVAGLGNLGYAIAQ
jgi:tRNA A-37 threonylcarbamoyl transferase component Bud32